MSERTAAPTLSAIVITKNEARDIGACLASLRPWVDEIVVFDSGSTDGTQAICREHGAVVYETDWPGFGAQKQRALDHAHGKWVLSIDADERVPPKLRDEILACIASPRAELYDIPRRSNYCGTWIHHSGWSPDYVRRLFMRGRAHFSDDLVHERVIGDRDARCARLVTPLLHYTYRDFSEVLGKIDSYSSFSATQKVARGKSGGLRQAVLHGLWTFIRTYVVKLGFLDGRMGFILAVSNAETSYYRYLKMMLISDGHNHHPHA
ncbi:glycosyltransferase family 2 protein [Burkholderia multivorans]|uniref:glycosyltransferase family 2 protein n=1 Tax=Burkholderia multivorans TaxID=87883 RepID=UPI000D0052AE|nr:glycosyltransferase family 2 protein [Burkholderia multivorans]MBU9135527.1 glycosyltransferase family 2 protein [Burkholderia multivorans]MBU9573811.1 glycosyltransferase family 2 protein [Burkholderia multivorans]MBU9598223.1 glycosyltransferase family 2 protein [Burkholderia multivorans]MCA8456729.1 glycosyltransferase family 2 protein [Burkholderia multivorans]MCA8486863.1 glycosyltransferase family 2 protein [Burkholderia multivorans]